MTRVRTREWSSTDYYAVLGVEPDAASADIDGRYRDLAKVLHPDRNADVNDQERFKRISAAYTALKDPATRAAYDEFRTRVDDGRLYASAPPASPAASATARRPDHLAPVRVPKTHRPMAPWLRSTIATVLIVLGVAAAVWALVGDLPAPTNADTPLAVQITLAIVALKFVVCGVAVARYPQLRARWHH